LSIVRCREELEQLHSYKPAKSLEQIKHEVGVNQIIKLAANENALGYSPLVTEAIREAESELFFYPDGHSRELREELANLYLIKPEQLVFGNGSFELISLIALSFIKPREESIIPEPSFGWYKNVTLTMGGVVRSVPLDQHSINLNKVFGEITSKTKVIWLCNPNNPTGTYFNKNQLEEFLKQVPSNIVVVLDEAYIEFVLQTDYPNSISLLDDFPNIIILRTFSKVYGLASLRIGYGIANPNLIEPINKIRMPINVNRLAQVAALASLRDLEFKKKCVQNNLIGKAFYENRFSLMGLKYIPTQTNFIMVNVNQNSDEVCAEMLKKGILIRSGTEFGMPTWLRITIGKPYENERVVQALQEVLSSIIKGGVNYGSN
jgi:histidinol-phosphate aminotransferase